MTDPHELFSDRLIHAYRRSDTIFIHGAAVAIALAGFLLTELPPAPMAAWFAGLLATMGYHCLLGMRLVAEERRADDGLRHRGHVQPVRQQAMGDGLSALRPDCPGSRW